MVNFLWDNILKSPRRTRDVPAILAENYLFQDLSRRELRLIEEIVHLRTYHAGETVFAQGEVGFGMYMIVRGAVDISISENPLITESSKSAVITRLVAGDFFGELSLIEDNGLRSASAQAHEESELIGFFKPDLVEVMERSPVTGGKVAYRLAQILGRRLRETTDKISALRTEIRSLKS